MADGKVKVAVLGGGMGAMSAALALTEIDPKGEKYEITVHQLGWRLGGKTASGRNPKYGQRIEEHGLHIWSGAYDNAFTIMRIAFKALNRPPGDPLATIGDAFKRQNQFFLTSDEDKHVVVVVRSGSRRTTTRPPSPGLTASGTTIRSCRRSKP